MTLEEQLACFDDQADIAFDRVLQMMVERREAIICKARGRLVQGFSVYGDLMWTWGETRLMEEAMEELADAVNYQVARRCVCACSS